MGDGAILRGRRVLIRYATPDDEGPFVAAVRASRELHVPWTFLAETPEGFRSLLERSSDPSDELYLICRRDEGAIVGMAHLGQIVLGDFRSAYLGYAAFAPHEAKGYMTEGLVLVLRHAFGTIGLHRVEANVQPGNDRSIALLSRLGFRREGFSPRYLRIGGEWRDHIRYALLSEEFAPP
jgi:ribosomal-protein-alanine N-acetyltransferase